MQRKSTEEVRNQLPDLLDAAEKGQSTIITRHGRPIAALVPIAAYSVAVRQHPLLPLAAPAAVCGPRTAPVRLAGCVTNGGASSPHERSDMRVLIRTGRWCGLI